MTYLQKNIYIALNYFRPTPFFKWHCVVFKVIFNIHWLVQERMPLYWQSTPGWPDQHPLTMTRLSSRGVILPITSQWSVKIVLREKNCILLLWLGLPSQTPMVDVPNIIFTHWHSSCLRHRKFSDSSALNISFYVMPLPQTTSYYHFNHCTLCWAWNRKCVRAGWHTLGQLV